MPALLTADVDAAVALHGFGEEAFDVRRDADVGAVALDLGARGLRQLGGLGETRLVQVYQGQSGTLGGESLGHTAADAAGRAGDQGNPSFSSMTSSPLLDCARDLVAAGDAARRCQDLLEVHLPLQGGRRFAGVSAISS